MKTYIGFGEGAVTLPSLKVDQQGDMGKSKGFHL